MTYSLLWVLLLTAGSAFAETNVNISFSQLHSKNAGRFSDSSMGDVGQFKSDSVEKFVGNESGRSARIQTEEKDNGQTVKYVNNMAEGSNINSAVMSDSRSVQEQSGHFSAEPLHNHYRSMYNSNPIEYQRNGQFRKMNDQQNMEFERYIHHYHNGPTVETVYESADAMPQHSSSSRVNDGLHAKRSGRIVKFERQVALPATSSDAEKQVQHQPVQASESVSSASTSSSSVPSVSVSTASGNNLKNNLNQRPASVGGDGLNFDQSTSYNKPNYYDPTTAFKYSDDKSDTHYRNQYPPSVGEPQGGFGGYFTNNADSHYYGNGYVQPQVGGHNYLPPETSNQRPAVVTKTIQIAQPAIKTKKYEVRHPAIQKEFYDIEERVLIKPAGTVVVELERPVAKIPKGESILPLGHPHPAVAGAYMNNGNTPSFSNFVYSSPGSSTAHNQGNNQYSSNAVYNTKPVSEHRKTMGSSITSTPTFDQSSKELAVEANLNKQYNADGHFTATAAPVVEESKSRNREVIVVTDGQGNQRQVSPDQFVYSRDETDRAPSRSGYNLHSHSNHNAATQRTNFQPSHSNRNDYDFEAEYINNAGNGNIQRESKPARLEVAPVRMTERQQQPIIKHEHNIHLAPSQHKIYLTQQHGVPQSRYVEERAHVQEVKPYLHNHPGPVVVYAAPKQRSEGSFRQIGSEYQPQSQVVNYRNSGGVSNKVSGGSSRLEISAPYAQMRYLSDDQFVDHHHSYREFSSNERENRKLGKLILEEKPAKEVTSSPSSNANLTETQAHIQISIPHSSGDSKKPITVSSTIRPMMSSDGDEIHNAKLEISVTNNGEPKNHQMDISNSDSTNNERLANSRDDSDCDKITKKGQKQMEEKFMRLVEVPSESNKEGHSAAESASSNIQTNNVDVNNKGASGHVVAPGSGTPGHDLTPGSRVIAATPAPKDFASGSESFHKRRIVVNHPFQTVRTVVEHEPYTNYHEVQVNEPASPALYHSAAYFQTHGSLRQAEPVVHEQRHLAAPVYYH